MSVQAGIWNFDGPPVNRSAFKELSSSLTTWGPDGATYHWDANLALLYRPFHTNKESRLELQPHHTSGGALITWDGRLDNRRWLLKQVAIGLDEAATDVSIVGALWDQYGTSMFSQLIGDFACAILDCAKQTLYLSRDFVGVRKLFYALSSHTVVWCTVLDPLCLHLSSLVPDVSVTPCERWIAGYLAWMPEPDVTPISEVSAVPPAHWIQINAHGKIHKYEYWRFRSNQRIRYRTDREYEEHFRELFFQAVERRLRCDRTVAAELSGGLDSSCIVCTASKLLDDHTANAPGLVTLSRYTESNPLGDRIEAIECIERWIGKSGYKFSTDEYRQELIFDNERFATVFPDVRTNGGLLLQDHWHSAIESTQARVVLSGEGGDELTGAHQSPAPLLAQQLVTLQWISLILSAFEWSARKKVRIGTMFGRTLRYALMKERIAHSDQLGLWLAPDFIERTRYRTLRFSIYPHRYTMPEHRRYSDLFEDVRRIIGIRQDRCEYSFPFIDRDLCEFGFAIPFNQLLRPNQRRSLLRRSMRSLVPEQVLEQKGKCRGSDRGLQIELFIRQIKDELPPDTFSGGALRGIFASDLEDKLNSALDHKLELPKLKLLKILSVLQWQQRFDTKKRFQLSAIQPERR